MGDVIRSFTVEWVDPDWERSVFAWIDRVDADRDLAKQLAWTGALA